MTPPNIVLILMDDLGYGDLSCYNPNSGIFTPNIDRLAAEGIRFTQFYATSNICSPSRRALLTGRYQSRLGEWAEAYRGTPTFDAVSGTDEPCFSQYLKKAGYATGSFGKWNIGEVNGVSTPDAQGFDTWIGSFHNHSYFGHKRDHGTDDFWENGELAPQYAGRYSDDVFIDKAIDFIRANRANPFFVYLPLCTPHAPFQDPVNPVEGPEFAWWNEKTGGNKNCDLPREQQRPLLTKMVEHVDRRIGELLGALTELGLDENTIVLFSSDNGGTPASINAPLRGYKQGMLDGGIRVPTIAKWPGVYPAGVVSRQVGILTDFSRTIVEAPGAAGHTVPGRPLDGIDLTPILTGSCAEEKRELGWRRREWSLDRGGYNNVWAEAYIKGDWKYIREFKEAPSFARSVDDGYPETGYLELLYNLADDVHEDRNLAYDAPEKLAELRAAFEEWKARTVDADNHYKIPFPDQYLRP